MTSRRIVGWLAHAARRFHSELRSVLDTARREGTARALAHLAQVVAWHLSPWRRAFVRRLERERALGLEFDARLGVDTSGEVALTEVGVSAAEARRGHGLYRGIWSGLFHAALRDIALPLGRLTFVDYGSGKGKALLLAATYPFRRIVGVEYAPGLLAVARHNLAVFQDPGQRCFSLGAEGADALVWEPPAEPLLCFFFNPFDDRVLERVLERLGESWRRVPRDIYLLYVNVRDIREQARVFEQCTEVSVLQTGRHALLAKITPHRVHEWRP